MSDKRRSAHICHDPRMSRVRERSGVGLTRPLFNAPHSSDEKGRKTLLGTLLGSTPKARLKGRQETLHDQAKSPGRDTSRRGVRTRLVLPLPEPYWSRQSPNSSGSYSVSTVVASSGTHRPWYDLGRKGGSKLEPRRSGHSPSIRGDPSPTCLLERASVLTSGRTTKKS